MVIIPDYYRGTYCNIFKEDKASIESFCKRESTWEGKLKDDWEKSILPYISEHGASTIGSVGTA